jgi:hypothetical protein
MQKQEKGVRQCIARGMSTQTAVPSLLLSTGDRARRVTDDRLLHIKNARSQDFSVEPKIPMLCNFITFKNYNNVTQVRNPCLFLL